VRSHTHPPGTAEPDGRGAFLIDGCERCDEYLEDLGVHFDADRFRAFWAKMVEVEYDDVGGYESDLDKQLGRRLYIVALSLQRGFGLDPRDLAKRAAPGGLASDVEQARARERDLLIEFTLWMSPVWEKGNSDDEESAALAVDAFFRGDGRDG
jgi:hypothetical protein